MFSALGCRIFSLYLQPILRRIFFHSDEGMTTRRPIRRGPACLLAALAVAALAVLTACTGGDAGRQQEAQLDSARVATTGHMDYRRAERLCLEVRDATRNKLLRLLADVQLMKLCQICSQGKRFYDYRSDAERLMQELRTGRSHMDPHRDSLWQRALQEFDMVSAVYYYNLRDYDQAQAYWPALMDPGRERGQFLGQYIGRQTLYFRSMQKKWAADRLTEQGLYGEALDSLAAALYLINEHHRRYAFTGMADTLFIYGSGPDTLSTEMRWIQTEGLAAVPEWMASVREQLSITLGAMGRKAESDYNHNIYFDILDATRLDMQGEQRLDELLSHERLLNLLLGGLCLLAVVTVVLTLSTYRRRRRATQEKIRTLRGEIEAGIASLTERWQRLNLDRLNEVEEQMEEADEARMAAELELEKNKRSYAGKAASVAIAGGIMPFLDRALHEVDKQQPDVDYLTELIDKINDYNEVLGQWVHIRQGEVSLAIESFLLDDVFSLVSGANHLFEAAGLRLYVHPAHFRVKADKALTLFMINTLMDNARKFTPQGGEVTVTAVEGEQYVNVLVIDTGYGMTEEETREVVTARRGHGFGLMNCRGIIEKYRKLGGVFSQCKFGVKSKPDEGSTFYFCLPKAADPHRERTTPAHPSPAAGSGAARGRVLTALLLLASAGLHGRPDPGPGHHLDRARQMADSVFYCNTQGDYSRAIGYGDSVVTALNRDYMARTGRTDHLLLIEGEPDDMPEVRLWQEGFQTDYGIIVDVRNELAIAALSLNRKHLYRYNSDVFTRMYQLLAQDETQSERIRRLERTNANKGLVVNLTMLLLLLFVAFAFMLYYHRHLLPLFNLRQVSQLNDSLLTLPREQLMPRLHEGIGDIVAADGVCVATFDAEHRQLRFDHSGRRHPAAADPTGRTDTLEQFMTYTYHNGEPIRDLKVGIVSLPLRVDVRGDERLIGVLGVMLHSARLTEREAQMLDWVARSLGVYLYCTGTRLEELQRQLELKQDEARLAETERNRVHVQNMILDNCLSTIKHETMYYPSRIGNLLQQGRIGEDGEARRDVAELMHYYKDVFTVLYQCAMKQLERPVFRRRPIPLRQLADYAVQRAEHYQSMVYGQTNLQVNLPPAMADSCVLGDMIMLQYMLDTLLEAAFRMREKGTLRLDFDTAGDFCAFALTDDRLHWTQEQMATLFYADSLKYNIPGNRLLGAEYLICKQVIREHDEHVGVRGCRIYARDGNTVAFTLPLKKKV